MNKIEETAMLFDWFSDRGQPFQVQGIDVDNGGRHHLCSSIYGWDNNADVAPMPVNKEVMEINGFTQWVTEPQVYYKLAELPDVVFCINDENESNTCSITALVDYNGIMHVLMTVTYIHELQRVLRQCGLHEFANQFKIK